MNLFIRKTIKSYSEWLTIKSGVPQGSVLGPLFFVIYINDLSDTLESHAKLFADDTSMFPVVRDPINTSQKLNNDLDKVSLLANRWKMFFNPDPSGFLILLFNKYHLKNI